MEQNQDWAIYYFSLLTVLYISQYVWTFLNVELQVHLNDETGRLNWVGKIKSPTALLMFKLDTLFSLSLSYLQVARQVGIVNFIPISPLLLSDRGHCNASPPIYRVLQRQEHIVLSTGVELISAIDNLADPLPAPAELTLSKQNESPFYSHRDTLNKQTLNSCFPESVCLSLQNDCPSFFSFAFPQSLSSTRTDLRDNLYLPEI